MLLTFFGVDVDADEEELPVGLEGDDWFLNLKSRLEEFEELLVELVRLVVDDD